MTNKPVTDKCPAPDLSPVTAQALLELGDKDALVDALQEAYTAGMKNGYTHAKDNWVDENHRLRDFWQGVGQKASWCVKWLLALLEVGAVVCAVWFGCYAIDRADKANEQQDAKEIKACSLGLALPCQEAIMRNNDFTPPVSPHGQLCFLVYKDATGKDLPKP